MGTFLGILVFTCILVYLVVFAYRMHLDSPHVNARIQREQQGKRLQKRTSLNFSLAHTTTQETTTNLQEITQSIVVITEVIRENTQAIQESTQRTEVHFAKMVETVETIGAQNQILLEQRAQSLQFRHQSVTGQERVIPLVDLGQDGSKASGKVDAKSRQEVIAELLLEEPTIGGKEIERRTGIPDATARRILKELKSTDQISPG